MTQNKLIFITIIILLLLGLNLGGFETDYQIGTELVLSDNLGKDQKVLRLSGQNSEEYFLNNIVSRPRLSTQKVVSTQSYIERGPISISSNINLKLNFPGEGTIDDPVRIEGYNITPAIGYSHLIEIRDTTIHFCIVDNLLNGNATAFIGIYLENVIHGTIVNNFVFNNSNMGIYIDLSSRNNTVDNNTIYDNDGRGIESRGSNSTIANNRFFNNYGGGIHLDKAHNTTISNNTVYNCSIGIMVVESNDITVSHNIIHDGIDISPAIYLLHSNNAIIPYNTIYNYENGIALDFSTHNTITNNTIYSCSLGINIYTSSNNRVAQNVIYNSAIGISLDNSIYNTISANNISYSDEDGIGLGFSDHNIIVNNLVFDNDGNGINLWDSSNNSISNNTVFNNTNDGIILCNSHNQMISDNTVYDGPRGITLWDSNNNIISKNKVYNSQWLGLSLWHDNVPSHNNTVTGNIFLNNNPWGESQASDEGSNNVFRNNFWNDWTGPDTNGDGVVDEPYIIDGSANNQDNYPLVSFTHFLSSPSIISPNGGETLNGKILIEWATAFDLFNHPVTYTVYYSSDEGATWTQLITGLTTTSYSWDTNTVPDGFSYLIKVVTTCSEGLSREDISDGTFTIQNTIPTTLTTSISTTSVSSPGLTGIILLLSFFTLITVKRKFFNSKIKFYS